jgi:NADH dehydrogenase
LEDATAIRRRILLSFERAERETDPKRRAALLTFVIVGGGPTGVELAGAIAELAYQNLPPEYRHIDTRKARVVLIEAGPRILPSFTPDLSAYAHKALERLGVEIQLGKAVRECGDEGVIYGDEALAAKAILWAAGVRASSAASWAGLPADSAGRAKVDPDLTAPGHPEIFVIGDTATIDAWHGKPVPGIAPAAKQQGVHVAGTIRMRLRALKNWTQNGPPRDPAAWLILVGRNAALDASRRYRKHQPLPADDALSDLDDVETQLAERLDSADYRDDLLRLLFVSPR